MVLAIAVLLTTGALLAPGQVNSAPRPLVQLIQDLDAATSRAHLTDTQKKQLDADRVVLERARMAKEQGAAVDRRKVSDAVKSIRQAMNGDAFTTQDKQTIAADIDVLRKR